MTEKRPFKNMEDLKATAERIWWSLDRQDWLEAFRSHPKIGESTTGIPLSQTTLDSPESLSHKWSEQEQSGVNTTHETVQALAELNREYEKKFGYIFIVCATGKTSGEMLSILRERLQNDSEKELRTAATEQAKITALRLEKLLNL